MSEETYLIRLYRPDSTDKEQIARLQNSGPMGDDVKFCFNDEPPRYETVRECVILVAEIDELDPATRTKKIVGQVAGTIRRVLLRPPDGVAKVSWVFMLRVDAEHRRHGLASLLIRRLEQVLVEKGVVFATANISNGNVPSLRLFCERLNYKLMFQSYRSPVNVGHVRRILPSEDTFRDWSQRGIRFEKLAMPDSLQFLRDKFSSSFFFPAANYPPNCTVYSAKMNDELVACTVADRPEKWTIVGVRFLYRVKWCFLTLLNYFFPRWFEKPLRLGPTWRVRMVFPCHARVTSPTGFGLLFDALVASVVKDLHGSTDVLMIYDHPMISGLDQAYIDVLRRSPFISPSLFKGSAMCTVGKSLLSSDPTQAAQMEALAASQNFWFVDSQEF